MLSEYALEPRVIANKEACRYFLDQLGVEYGRLLAEIPRYRKWARAVYEAAQERGCRDVELKYIEERLATAKDKVMLRERRLPYDGNCTWLENAEANAEAIRAIISTENPRGHPNVHDPETIDESAEAWAVQLQRSVPTDGVALAELAIPLFEMSTRLVLVDPYFRLTHLLEKRWVRGILPLVAAFYQYSRIPESGTARVEAHSSTASFGVEASDRSEHASAFSTLIPRGEKATLCWWGPSDLGDAMHARYVLTDKGGLQVDRGLDSQRGKTTSVVLMSQLAHSQAWEAYRHRKANYDLVDEREVFGQHQVGTPVQ